MNEGNKIIIKKTKEKEYEGKSVPGKTFFIILEKEIEKLTILSLSLTLCVFLKYIKTTFVSREHKTWKQQKKYKTFEITFDLAFHIVFAFFFNNSKLFFCVSTRGEAAAAKKSSKVHAFNKKKSAETIKKDFV